MKRDPRRWCAALAMVAAMTIPLAACSSGDTASPDTPGTTADAATTTTLPTGETSSLTTPPPGTPTQRVTRSTKTVSEPPSTVTTVPTDPTLVPPPPSTSEPAPTRHECPYLSDKQVMYSNGQHTGATSIIGTKPYPVCIFTRSDGGYLATTRIVEADTEAEAAAAVNQHVPVDESNPATHPAGWTGGAMATPDGVDGYPDARSIYAVSKGTIAIIAISNQQQSIKGRQMVTDIVENLGL